MKHNIAVEEKWLHSTKELWGITQLLTITMLRNSMLCFDRVVNIGDVYRVTGEDVVCLSFFKFIQTLFSWQTNKPLTLFWLAFPVYKVDYIAALQHVSLLLDQFGHVDHCAISATDKQTCNKMSHCKMYRLIPLSSVHQETNTWRIARSNFVLQLEFTDGWIFSTQYLMSSSHASPELSSCTILQCSPETSLLAGKDR